MVKRCVPNKLSPEDRLTCRRWRRSVLALYCLAVMVLLGLEFLNRQTTDLIASAELSSVSSGKLTSLQGLGRR